MSVEFVYDEYRQKKIREKIDEQIASRVKTKVSFVSFLYFFIRSLCPFSFFSLCYFVAGSDTKYHDQRVYVSFCLSVCPLAYLKKAHVHISPSILYMLPVAVARSFSDGNAMCHVLLVCG